MKSIYALHWLFFFSLAYMHEYGRKGWVLGRQGHGIGQSIGKVIGSSRRTSLISYLVLLELLWISKILSGLAFYHYGYQMKPTSTKKENLMNNINSNYHDIMNTNALYYQKVSQRSSQIYGYWLIDINIKWAPKLWTFGHWNKYKMSVKPQLHWRKFKSKSKSKSKISQRRTS